ncbi:MAG: AtpZ/AtpI family protein [Terriglobales bacterium]
MPSPLPDDRDSQKRSFLVLAARYSSLALALPASTFIGWVIGTLLDRWLHTTWLYLVGLILGIIAGFIELIRAVTAPEAK